jgi:hypothetical protein
MQPPTSVCGRPLPTDISQYILYNNDGPAVPPSIIGDINYGIAYSGSFPKNSNGVPPLGPNLSAVPEGWYAPSSNLGCSKSGKTLGCPVGGYSSGGCEYPFVPVPCTITNADVQKVIFRGSTWPQALVQENQVACCINEASDSSTCSPNQCSQNYTTCQPLMKQVCNSSFWGTSSANVCDRYVSLTSSISDPTKEVCSEGSSCGSDLVMSGINSFFSQGGKLTDNDPFVPKMINWCSKFPGLCNSVLSQQCSAYSLSDLSPSQYSGRSNDPQGTNLMQACGCFLPSTNYVSQVPIDCSAVCAFPGTIPLTTEGCQATECVIDNVTLDFVNSTGGSLNINQTCGTCSADNPCVCYFNGVDVSSTSGPIQAQISTNCKTCFNYPGGGNPPVQIPCPSTSSSIPSQAQSFIFSHKTLFWIFFWTIIAVVIGVFVFKFWRNSRRP